MTLVRREAAPATAPGSTAASSCSSPACSTTSPATTRYFEREPLERLARDGELMAYRHGGFWQPMDVAARQEPARTALAVGPGAVEGVVSDAPGRAAGAALFDGVYAGRRVLVTGHTGFKGAWLCAWLAGLGADVRRLRPGAADRSQPVRAHRPARRGRARHRRRARPRRPFGGRRVVRAGGRLPPRGPAARAPSYADPRGDVRDQRHGRGEPARSRARAAPRCAPW